MSKSSGHNVVIRLLIGVFGSAFILLGAGSVILGFVGEKAEAVITDVRRQGGERTDIKSGRYTYSMSYRFTLPNGESIDGNTMKISGGVYLKRPNTNTTVRYLKSYPRISALEDDTKPNLGKLVLIVVGVLLILVVKEVSH